MSSQGPPASQTYPLVMHNRGIQGDASNWTQLLKRRIAYATLNSAAATNNSGLIRNASGFPVIQSNNFLVDYRLGAVLCPTAVDVIFTYPRISVGEIGC